MIRIVALLISLSIIIIGCNGESSDSSPTPIPTPLAGATLNVPFDFQETQNWCWAATIKMVSDYYGHYVEQCAILSYWYGAQCCLYPYACDTTGSSGQIIDTLTANGIYSRWVQSALTFEQVKNEINAGRPLIIGYRNSFSGHVVVVYGYTHNSELLIYDPYFGQFTLPYGASFSYGSGYAAMYWSETFYSLMPY